MTRKVREMLDQIDRFLVQGNQDSRDLWNILSALRGHDSNGAPAAQIKLGTTIPVRRAAFPQCAQAWGHFLQPIGACFAGGDEIVLPEKWGDDFHFNFHIDAARRSINREDK